MMRPYGWDQRDCDFWSALQNLPSYGLIAEDRNNPVISRRDVERLLEDQARIRAAKEKP